MFSRRLFFIFCSPSAVVKSAAGVVLRFRNGVRGSTRARMRALKAPKTRTTFKIFPANLQSGVPTAGKADQKQERDKTLFDVLPIFPIPHTLNKLAFDML